jgi:hypothetical protein
LPSIQPHPNFVDHPKMETGLFTFIFRSQSGMKLCNGHSNVHKNELGLAKLSSIFGGKLKTGTQKLVNGQKNAKRNGRLK